MESMGLYKPEQLFTQGPRTFQFTYLLSRTNIVVGSGFYCTFGTSNASRASLAPMMRSQDIHLLGMLEVNYITTITKG